MIEFDPCTFTTAEPITPSLEAVGYYLEPDHILSVEAFWALRDRPLLMQGEPGSGKTELPVALAKSVGAKLRFLSCYEGVGPAQSLYSWDTNLQRFYIEREGHGSDQFKSTKERIYNPQTLVPGVLMEALLDPNPHSCVVIDEIDKVPKNGLFSAMLLRFLETFTITIMETQHIVRPAAGVAPHVFITSNATDDDPLDAPLRRRSKFLRFRRPDPQRMMTILASQVPNLSDRVMKQVTEFVHLLGQTDDLDKPISLSETIAWAKTLAWMNCDKLTLGVVRQTVSDLGKGDDEQERIMITADYLFGKIGASAEARL